MERRASSPRPQLTMPGGTARAPRTTCKSPCARRLPNFNLGEGIPAWSVSSGVAGVSEVASRPKLPSEGQGDHMRALLAIRVADSFGPQ